MAEADRWESIRDTGLLSTTALLDRFGVAGAERERIESARRPVSVELQHPIHGCAVIRDNIPMTDSALLKCLQDCSPREWYEILNRRVFFWLSRERLLRLLGAKAYRTQRQLVITVDTEALLARHASRVTLSPINSGSTIMKPQPRGRDTFQPISEYPFEYWRRKRNVRDAVVELSVDYSVPDLRDFVLRAEHMEGGITSGVLWTRDGFVE
jgi:hypothetical protein